MKFGNFFMHKKNDYVKASHHFNKAVELDPSSCNAAYNLGLSLAFENKTADSVRWFKQALVLKPDFIEALSNLGVQYMKMKRSRYPHNVCAFLQYPPLPK
jgi:tetratricopeptide (TPR) repeat protein